MRSRFNYHSAHIFDSISFPVDLCQEDFFVNWDTKHIETEIIKNKEKLQLFKNRRRLFISIIAGSEEVQSMLQILPMLFSDQHIQKFRECPVFKGKKVAMEDVRNLLRLNLLIFQILSLRNAILLIKALRKERIREIYLCANPFNVFSDRYPQLCKFRTSVLYPKPFIAKNYPSEIL